ncbi:hypothetical protein HCUR_00931 [Holospora curviuscula]|uniref:Uncharacterized protein n=1 Tax=Holospora curviuscula TaxID=1082868 RepID=A0A2S5R8F7_9PROT|nr:hypothetical protein HCUR_00931 [Holospora curviuscula]
MQTCIFNDASHKYGVRERKGVNVTYTKSIPHPEKRSKFFLTDLRVHRKSNKPLTYFETSRFSQL